MQFDKRRKYYRIISALLLFAFLNELLFPTIAAALTGGPGQPEFQRFTPATASNMVNVFTGDFNYNIPLFDVGGYPLNLSYDSDVRMDEEASWVGLGWNLNIGSITRQVRGLPDDFKGDIVEKTLHTQPNKTFGMAAGVPLGGEVVGVPISAGVSVGAGIYYNNYKGINFEQSISPTLSIGGKNSTVMTAGLGITASGEGGLNITPSLGLNLGAFAANNSAARGMLGGINGSISFSSREGLTSLQLGHRFNVVGAPGLSYNHSFVDPTFVPSIQYPSTNTSMVLGVKIGGEAFGFTGWVDVDGYYAEQRVSPESVSTPAYGYYYSHNGSGSNILLDYNREKDGVFSMQKPAIAPAYFTPDAFSVNAQGISDGFKVYRGDVGFVFDRQTVSYSDGANVGLEVGQGNAVHPGVDVTIVNGESKSEQWTSFNNAYSNVSHKGYDNSIIYEPAFFKSVSESGVLKNKNLYNSLGDTRASRFALGNSGNKFDYPLIASLESYYLTDPFSPQNISLSGQLSRNNGREPRQKAISALTVQQARAKGFQPGYAADTAHGGFGAPLHHFGEFTVTNEEGKRYVFGLPVYNKSQKDVAFSVGKKVGVNYTQHLVSYSGGSDNSPSNSNGIDNFYSHTRVPSYAHSHLLTAVLSPDYEDVNQDGPTADDIGDYVKFNYLQHSGSYSWRMPFEENQAYYNAGLVSDVNDDQASYAYGEKELWYPSAIESKEYIAVFTYENRFDGHGVKGENGGIDVSKTQKLLKKITLYGRPDYIFNGVNGTPVKEAEFEYDYSLCPNVPNNKGGSGSGTGKLTLKKVFVTSGKSQRGKLNPYQFNYSVNNPPYTSANYDRWGYYKTAQGSLSNSEFPYSLQDSTLANPYASSWRLTEITLPSGGRINIDYESDDYAYVQDKPAMEMFKVVGVDSSSTFSTNATLWNGGDWKDKNLYLFFPLKQPTNNLSAFRWDYFHNLDHDLFGRGMYFKFKVKIGSASTDYEYIPGYAEIEDVGLTNPNNDGLFQHGWVKLKSVNIGDRDFSEEVHPISKAAWQMGRIHLPRKVWDLQQDPALSLSNVKGIAKTLLQSNFATQLAQTIAGPNRSLAVKGYGKNIDINRCWIRLLNPMQRKFGGGSRVKRITMNDQWSAMSKVSGAIDQQSGFTYDYKTIEAGGKVISSGVASYEPLIGNEETPQHQPIFYEKKNVLIPDDRFYIEEPLGEMVYPSPVVGYSKVTITPIHEKAPPLHRSGKVMHEFYTAKDFPVFTYRTTIIPKQRGRTALSVLVSTFGIGKVKDYLTLSQGFSVEINDMHGKQKAVWNFAEGQKDAISGQEFFYHTDTQNPRKLSNTISVIDKSGQVTHNETFGLEFLACADFRESITTSNQVGGQFNGDAFMAGLIPLIILTVWPQISGSETKFRSSSFTKVISRNGILKSVVNHDLNATVPTVNVLYEPLTGEPVLTATLNEFKDTIYSLKYPAYWAYENMGMAAANQSYFRSGNLTFTSGTAAVPSGIFREGDELILKSGAYAKAWVLQSSGTGIYAVNQVGQPITGNFSECLIYRSGRKNLLSDEVMMLASRENPAKTGNISGINNTYNILDVSAAEFSQRWQLVCGNDSCPLQPGTLVNPFLRGVLGHWRQNRNWASVTQRDSAHIRFAGTYQTFSPFWKPNTTPYNDFITDSTGWVWSATTTKMLPNGTSVEERDALGRFTSQIYGFCGEKVTAQAANARYSNIVYDSFEDFFSCGCNSHQQSGSIIDFYCEQHCKKMQPILYTGPAVAGLGNTISNRQAHTGSFSLTLRHLTQSADSFQAQIISPMLFENNCYPHTKSNSTSTPYTVDTCDCVGRFSPQSKFPEPCNKQKYVFSCWFRRTTVELTGLTQYPNTKITGFPVDSLVSFKLGNTMLIPSDTVMSPIIDGWQQLNYTFEIPGNCSGNQPKFTVILKNKVLGTYAFIDDIRIHPFEANMKSFVYDFKDFRHLATLDENNFASIYQYDREGNIVSVKKETERGIVSVSEYKQNMKSK